MIYEQVQNWVAMEGLNQNSISRVMDVELRLIRYKIDRLK